MSPAKKPEPSPSPPAVAVAHARGVVSEFRDFVLRGNVIDLAVGVVAGAAFNKVVESAVTDLIGPLIGRFGGDSGASFVSWTPLGMQLGGFISAIVTFLITMAAIFFVIVKPLNVASRLTSAPDEDDQPASRPCPECLSVVPSAARRCAHCTSPLSIADAAAT